MKRRDFLAHSTLLAASGVVGCNANSSGNDTAISKPMNQQAIDAMPEYSATGVNLIKDSTPAQDGFYYPAEWERHDFTIMTMPTPQNWEGYAISFRAVRKQWADVANALSEYEPVLMVVDPEEKRAAREILSRDIDLVEFPVNDGWSRDSGPMYVVNGQGQRRVAGFTFNGWGAKFPPYHDDALLKARLCEHLGEAMYPIDLVLEGGAVATDGEGTLLTTEQCLLNKNRTTSADREHIEGVLNASLGTSKVIWLGKGLAPDPVTDGHIDGIAAFAEPGAVLLHTTEDKSDVNYKITQDAKRKLQNSTDAQGRQLEIIDVPLDGDVSYMNFYIANDCVLVPITNDPRQDDRPMGILREVFSDEYEVIGVDGNVLGEGGGGIHCITQQVPKVQVG